MSSFSTNNRGDDGDKPQGLLYDLTTPNCHCGMQSHALGFVDGYDDGYPEVSTNNGAHVAVLQTKVDLLE
ncbi:hypothetical protein RHSIM_Rhsim03G0126600 [Rhododendron simsii]|uniref:Uncharacterized protein n=1 Tax=Rhododendron simsii TaxID=118357 RepID=A0A834HCE8_RHOSS|nr:hypothetical protein RHSIM_Rhsim03G0126600 [Rhododendron simsii]